MSSSVDLHIHSTASDGTDSPSELVDKVRSYGIHTFALTDHDTTVGTAQLGSSLSHGILFIPGIEFSCRTTSGKCHILGYACDSDHPEFCAALAEGAELRRVKLEQRLAYLQKHGIQFPTEEITKLLHLPSVGKPHLASLMVRFGYSETMQDAIRGTINLCHTGSSRIPAKTAIQAIVAAGGIPVWAHPLGGEGEREVCPDRFYATLDELTGYGLKGLECFYSKYPLHRCENLATIAQTHSLLISGGSDYHGQNKSIPPGTLNAEGINVPPERLTILNVI